MLTKKLGIFFVTILLAFAKAAPSKKDIIDEELPNNSHPVNYKLDITTNVHIGEKKFEVNEEITIIIDDPSENFIKLHNQNLSIIGEIQLLNKNDENIFKSYENEANDFMKIVFDNSDIVKDDQVILKVSFFGYLQDNSVGFYISWYKENNVTK